MSGYIKRSIIACEQGGEQWHHARLGLPTASRFADIVTPGGKATKNAARETYKCQLLAERLTRQLMQNYVTPAMMRGTELEPQARAWYELETWLEVKRVGLAIAEGDGWKCGASPDGLCADRGLEIKCPLPHTLIAQLLEDGPPGDYIPQVQAGMWVCGLARWDLVLFSGASGIPNRIFEIEADSKMHAAFAEHIPAFCAELDAAEARLIALGGGGVRDIMDAAADGNDWPEGLR